MKTRLAGLVAALTACAALGNMPIQAADPPESIGSRPDTTYLAQFYWPGYGYHSATPAESYAMGAAALGRARGEYNLLTARARVAATEARRHELENRLRATELYFQIRDLNRAYRARRRGPRPTLDDLKRYAQATTPPPLSPSELDFITGEITWPMVLRADRYAEYRAQLEALFAERASGDEISAASYLQIDRTAKAMLAELKRRIRQVPQMDYIAAKRFIQSLAYEVRRPTS